MNAETLQTISVGPRDAGWAMRISGANDEQTFASGAAAEAAARRLAQRRAAAGLPSRLILRLRDGSVAGRFLIPPTLEAA